MDSFISASVVFRASGKGRWLPSARMCCTALTFSAWLSKVGSSMPSHAAETEAFHRWQGLRAFSPRSHPVRVTRVQLSTATRRSRTISKSVSSLSFRASSTISDSVDVIDHTLLISESHPKTSSLERGTLDVTVPHRLVLFSRKTSAESRLSGAHCRRKPRSVQDPKPADTIEEFCNWNGSCIH